METLRNLWEGIRTTYDTRGDNLRLAYEVRSRRVPPFYVLDQVIGSQIASLPDVKLPEVSSAGIKIQLIALARSSSL